ncbi:MAG: hypothetical protein AB7L13_20500 [Acidimicrobiia bacterium]
MNLRRAHVAVTLTVLSMLGAFASAGASESTLAAAASDAPRVQAFGAAPAVSAVEDRALNGIAVAIAPTATGQGFWVASATGDVLPYGDAVGQGTLTNLRLNQPIVGMAATTSGNGYWLVASDGGVFAFGDARFYGSTGSIRLNQPVVGIAATATNEGYWLVASDGGVFAFGDARFYGSTGSIRLNQPVVGMARTGTSAGYRLVAADGGVFAFGDALFLGSTGGSPSASPVITMTPTPGGDGYWLFRRDGSVATFGGAADFGGAVGGVTISAATANPFGTGYWLLERSNQLPQGGTQYFPAVRMVAFYGSSADPRLGVMGEGTPQQAAQRLLAQAAPYRNGDRPVLPAFEFIASIALASPGPNGNYSAPIPVSQIRPYLDAIRAIDGVMILDIQPGRSDFLTEVKRFESLLLEPDVSLALDPEWHVGPTQIPAKVIGTVDAAEVNAASAYLSDLVTRNGLPNKLFVIHRFTEPMVTNANRILERPGLETLIHADGFGGRAAKLADYNDLTIPGQPRGLKLFYDEDVNMFQPSEVLALKPIPDLITYQ